MVDGEANRREAGGCAAACVVRVDRRQISWAMLDVEQLIEEDHPARAIWELVGRLDLAGFTSTIASLEGTAGRPAYDPHLLISLWVYAYSRGIGSAREVARRCEHDPAFRWLTGLMVVNHHTLPDFRLAHRAALDELFTQVLGLLSAEGLIELRTVTHDGTKIAADAGGTSFCSAAHIEMHLAAVPCQVDAMSAPDDEESVTLRQRPTRERARRERVDRLERAFSEIERRRAAKPDGSAERSEQRLSTTAEVHGF